MKKQRRVMFFTTLIGILIFASFFLMMYRFVKRTQVSDMQSLQSDYQEMKKNKDTKYLNRWAEDHNLTIVTDTSKSKNGLQKQVSDAVSVGQLSNTNPYKIQNYNNGKYIFYLLDSTVENHPKVMVKRYNSVWNYQNLLIPFTVIYFALLLILLWFQYRNYREQRDYIHAIVKKLKHIDNNEKTDSLITKEDTPYTELIHAVNALDKHNTKLVEDNKLQKRRFKSLIGHLPVGVMLLDENGNVILHNQTMAIILGRNIQDEKHSFVDDIQTYSLSRMIAHTLRKNRNHHREIQLFGDSNNFVDANVIRIAHSDESLEKQVIVILYDLTQVRQIEKKEIKFAHEVGKEIKSPVREIKDSLGNIVNKNDVEDENVKNIKSASKRLSELINDTSALTEMDQQTTNVLPDRVNTDRIVQNTLDGLQDEIKTKDLTINYEHRGNEWVSSDERDLTQIFQHLINNAIKYNNQSGSVHIITDHNEVENYLNITIADTGQGISKADQKRVFDRFYRADQEKAKQIGGTGLGLPIVKESVDELNGTINLKSSANQGTTFKVNIPL